MSLYFKIKRRAALAASAAVAFSLAVFGIGNAGAEDAWPTKSVKLVVPFAAGGPSDVVAREVARALGDELGQPFVIVNQGGGAGVPALNAVAQAPADGYTLLFPASANVVVQPLLQNERVDVLTQLAPVSLVSTSPHMLVVTSKLPIKSTHELIVYAKANPGKVNFGSAGVGGLAHLGMELFKHDAKIDVTHIPYKGTAQVISDLAGGEVQALFSSMPSLKPMIDKGWIRPVGMTAKSDSPLAQGVPLISETLPGFGYNTWYAIYATARTPKSVIDRLNGAVRKVLADKDLSSRLETQGVDLQSSTPEELAELTRNETRRWDKIIRDAKIDLD